MIWGFFHPIQYFADIIPQQNLTLSLTMYHRNTPGYVERSCDTNKNEDDIRVLV